MEKCILEKKRRKAHRLSSSREHPCPHSSHDGLRTPPVHGPAPPPPTPVRVVLPRGVLVRPAGGQLPPSASPFPPSLPGHPAAAQPFPRLWLRIPLGSSREPPTPCALHLAPTTHHRCFWGGNPGSRRRAPGNEIGAPTAPPGLARPHLDAATHRLSNLRRPGFEIKDLGTSPARTCGRTQRRRLNVRQTGPARP